jgi:hypothetical protein
MEQAGQSLNIKLSEQPTMVCGNLDEEGNICDGNTFFPVMFFKELSPMMSPSGREEIIPVETYRCTVCGSIPSRFPQP